jgi:hypothetical protein
LLQAWFAEFADILLKNDSLGHGGHIQRNLGEKGAFDILKSIAKKVKISNIPVPFLHVLDYQRRMRRTFGICCLPLCKM